MGNVKQYLSKKNKLTKHESICPPTNTDRSIGSIVENHHMVLLDAAKKNIA